MKATASNAHLPWRVTPKALIQVLAVSCLCAAACGKARDAEPECEGDDCAAGEVCSDGVCVPVGPKGCDPPCGVAQPVCDEERGFCKVCTLAEGCEGMTPFCLPAANGGEGLCVGCRGQDDCTSPALCDPVSHACVGCTETEGCGDAAPICNDGSCVVCTDEEGCGEDAPICDRSVTGGACVVCTKEAGCGGGAPICDRSVAGGACVLCIVEEGCSGETPVCDTGVPGGACVECVVADECDGGRLCSVGRCVNCEESGRGCLPPEPHCDVTAEDGLGACVGCRGDEDCPGSAGVCHPERRVCVGCASDLDCTQAKPRCDPGALAGKGACVACISHADCGGATPVCDRAADEGLGACIACTEERGCGVGTFCDTRVTGGACVTCTETRGCGGDAPVCDTSIEGGACKACLVDGDCAATPSRPLCDRTRGDRGACVACTRDHRGCGGDRPYCWPVGDWGAGVCNRCTATEGCGGETPICDLGAPGGSCVVCTATLGCSWSAPHCDTAVPRGACKKCLEDGTGCNGGTPACDPDGGGGLGECVRCVSNADCPPSAPACDRVAGACVGCMFSTDCTNPLTPVCDVPIRKCVRCTATEGCDASAPYCYKDTIFGNGTFCAECLDNSECEAGLEFCFVGECQNGAQITIQAVRGGTGTTIRWATVTYLKPAIGSEAAGFFIQAEQWGPALFVSIDPTSLSPSPVVGDRVRFDVAATGLVGGALHVMAVTNWQIMSSGNPVQPLIAEIGSDPYLTAAVLESRLVSFTGTLGPISVSPGGYSTVPVTTAVWGPTPTIQLRLPEVLQDALALVEGCTVTLVKGPVWLSGTTAFPSAYAPEDLSSVSCPVPVSRTFSDSP